MGTKKENNRINTIIKTKTVKNIGNQIKAQDKISVTPSNKGIRRIVKATSASSSEDKWIENYYEGLNLHEMLNVSSMIYDGIKGRSLQEEHSNEYKTALEIINFYNNPIDKEKAEKLIELLNHKIVLENSKGLNKAEGRKFLNNLVD